MKWGIDKFHFHLMRCKCTLFTDHQPPIYILENKYKLLGLCETRLLYYTLFLQNFQIDIRYCKSEQHGNANAFSRYPLNSQQLFSMDSVTAFQLEHMCQLTLNSKQIAMETMKDPESQKARHFSGRKMTKFFSQSGCILNGMQICID